MNNRHPGLHVAGRFNSFTIALLGAVSMLAGCIASPDLFAKGRAIALQVEKITIGEDTVDIRSTQLIEVAVKNGSKRDIAAVVKLRITLPNHNIVSFGHKKIIAKAQTVIRALFPYWIGKNRAGEYTIGAKVFSLQGKLLAKSSKSQEQYFFARDPSKKHQPPRLRGKKRVKQPEKKAKAVDREAAPIQFIPPDLLWKGAEFINKTSILRGETVNIQLQIHNDGGDIATNTAYSVFWYFVPRPRRKIRFYGDVFKVIAPGERKIIELPVTIPDSEQKGRYRILAVADENNEIKEKDETNNQITSDQDLMFSDIALVSPDDGHSFAEDGLYKFEWRCLRYNQYKVEISADPAFLSKDSTFRIPKGEGDEGWTSSTSLKPLEGEMVPGLALGALKSNHTDHLYWRVIARNSKGETAVSEARRFFIRLKARTEP